MYLKYNSEYIYTVSRRNQDSGNWVTCPSHRVPKLVSDKNGKCDFWSDRKAFIAIARFLSWLSRNEG